MNAVQTYNKPSGNYAEKLANSVAAVREHLAANPGDWTQAHSLGAEDVVVTQLLHLAGALPAVSAFVLDTGKLHEETLALIPLLEHRFGISVQVFRPHAQDVVHFVKKNGERAMYESLAQRKACCDVRKMQPLAEALKGKTGWITGLRREQSAARADVSIFGQDGERLKLNPLVDWTWGDVWHCIATNDLPYNALHDAFYPSIGCAPCTRAISLGEDFRAGRWWWESSELKECGLHVQDASAPLASCVSLLSETSA